MVQFTSPNSGPSIQCLGGAKANIETQVENKDVMVMYVFDTIVTAHSQDVTGTDLQAAITLRIL